MTFSNTRQQILVNHTKYDIYNIMALEEQGHVTVSSLPFSLRILLENMLRHAGTGQVTESDIQNITRNNGSAGSGVIPFFPSRVLMQDFTGVPAVVDLAAMRDAVAKQGLDPEKINPLIPVDLVIDHSIQVDHYKEKDAARLNAKKEYQRNKERYQLLKWAQKSFDNFRVVPPESGICHQVNLEYLASVVSTRKTASGMTAFPDTLVGTDSHTTMINGLGVLGWGVGGIEAEAVMLGQPYFMTLPEVIGVNFINRPGPGITATDIVLYITQVLRNENVVEKIVEYTGPGLKALSLTDRATIANMAPEYGATAGFFPVDEETISFLKLTSRKEAADLVEVYCRTCGIFNRYTDDIQFARTIDIDLALVVPSVAGPSKPQDRIPLKQVKEQATEQFHIKRPVEDMAAFRPDKMPLAHGSIVIAAITSCTNTSNPALMIGAGLAARNAVEKGLEIPWFVKTSLAPGSRVVIDYLEKSGLLPFLEKLGFNNVGFGCTTCIGNSGPLDTDVEKEVKKNKLDVMAVLSGNRNFEARVHQLTRGNFLMSPVLVVMYALAGRIDIDFDTEPIGYSHDGTPVFYSDILPDTDQIEQLVNSHVHREAFHDLYSTVFTGEKLWQDLHVEKSATFSFDPDSQYIRNPPFFADFTAVPPEIEPIREARPLLILGHTVTTDHISPAGAIPVNYPAGQYLTKNEILPEEFNSYGSRRGNHEVMMRGTFANIRIDNTLSDLPGGMTRLFPEQEQSYVFDASMTYQKRHVPLLVFAGKEYGTGSSRDWAAKGTNLLGIKAVIAQSFERIHRSNLVGMGVLPLTFKTGDTYKTLDLTGEETFDIDGLDNITPGGTLTVTALRGDARITFDVNVMLYTDIEVQYYRNGGILPYVLRLILSDKIDKT